MAKLHAEEYTIFESIKQIEDDIEFWYARDLATVLDYSKWENFSKVIKRAMLACKNSGYDISEQFPEVRKLFEVGHGANRRIWDRVFPNVKAARYANRSERKRSTFKSP